MKIMENNDDPFNSFFNTNESLLPKIDDGIKKQKVPEVTALTDEEINKLLLDYSKNVTEPDLNKTRALVEFFNQPVFNTISGRILLSLNGAFAALKKLNNDLAIDYWEIINGNFLKYHIAPLDEDTLQELISSYENINEEKESLVLIYYTKILICAYKLNLDGKVTKNRLYELLFLIHSKDSELLKVLEEYLPKLWAVYVLNN